MVAHIYWCAMSYVVYSILIGDVSNVDFLLQVILAILRHDTVYSSIQTCGHTHLRTYIINELGKWICVNVSIDTAVEPSGLCGLVVRTFVARYGTRLLGLWGSQVRILSEANFSHIFRNRVC